MRIETKRLALLSAAGIALSIGCAPQEIPVEPEPVPAEPTVDVTPSSAPAGEEVTVRGRGFPANTTVEIGIGPPRSWYDEIARAQTDARGSVTAQVTVPSLESGREYVWVIAEADVRGGDKAISDEFLITSGNGPGEGHVTVHGEVTDEGVECPAVRDHEDGALFTLAGAPDWVRPGQHVRVEGSVAEASFCQQGTTIDVEHIERTG